MDTSEKTLEAITAEPQRRLSIPDMLQAFGRHPQTTPQMAPRRTASSPNLGGMDAFILFKDEKEDVFGSSETLAEEFGGLASAENETPGQLRVFEWEEADGLDVFALDIGKHSICRRSDNSWVNATKMLNFAGLTRGRRDGILKKETEKQIIREGNANTIGIWIPLERARALAREKGIEHKLAKLLADFPRLHMLDDPQSTNETANPTKEADDDAMALDSVLDNTIDRDVAEALAEFRSLDRRASSSHSAPARRHTPIGRLNTPSPKSKQSKSPRPAQVVPEVPKKLPRTSQSMPNLSFGGQVYYAPFPKPEGLNNGTLPPFIWLAMPSEQADAARATFGSDKALEQAHVMNFDLTKIPIYSILDKQ